MAGRRHSRHRARQRRLNPVVNDNKAWANNASFIITASKDFEAKTKPPAEEVKIIATGTASGPTAGTHQ